MASPSRGSGGTTAPPELPAAVFDAIADRLADRTDDLALIADSGGCYADWVVWEAFVGCRRAGWTVRPQIPYSELGVTGSRDVADLHVFDPASGSRVLIELAVIHDWTNNRWIDTLDGDTEKLSRPLTDGVIPFQIVVTASSASPIEVNPMWMRWLGMSKVWHRPIEMQRAFGLGDVGQCALQGWVVK
jgi:hypothetical protein